MGRDRKALIVLAVIVALAGLVLLVGVILSARFDRDVGDCAVCRVPNPLA